MVAEKNNFSSNAQHNFAKGKVISITTYDHSKNKPYCILKVLNIN